MGCWNGTCGVTQLSIRSGDPIALFLIVNIDDQDSNDFGHCHSDDIWSPLGLPVYGQYDDYGWIENVDEDGPNERNLVAMLRAMAVPVQAKNEYRAGVVPETLKWEDINDAIHSAILRVRDDAGIEYAKHFARSVELGEQLPRTIREIADRVGARPISYRVGLMMVHREIYDALSDSYPDWLYDPMMITLGQSISEAKQVIEESKHRVENFGKFVERTDMLLSLCWSNNRSLFANFFTHYQTYASQYTHGYHHDMIALLRGKEPIQPWSLEQLITEVCRFQIFRANMSALRKSWEPQAGSGSQHDNERDHLRLMDLTRVIIDRRLENEDREAEDC